MLPFSAIVATEHVLCCVNCTVSHSVSDTQTFQLSNLGEVTSSLCYKIGLAGSVKPGRYPAELLSRSLALSRPGVYRASDPPQLATGLQNNVRGAPETASKRVYFPGFNIRFVSLVCCFVPPCFQSKSSEL